MNEETDQPKPSTVEVQHSNNFIVGEHGTINNLFRDHRTLAWIVIGTVVTVLAVGISTYVLFPDPDHQTVQVAAPALPDPRPKVELSGLAVADPALLDADRKLLGYPQQATSIDVTPVDITLKNTGNAPAVIVRADVEFTYVETLFNCTGSGPGLVTANYDITFPSPPDTPARPFSKSHGMRFIIEAGKVDRLTLTLGPDKQPEVTSLVIGAHITLVFDDDSRFDVGNVALLTTSGTGAERFSIGSPPNSSQLPCQQKNASVLDRLYQIPATRSAEIEQLHHDYPAAK
ncbi:hypothetical protein [Nocardia vinacea]|uniref:hypothetical protein n=1 Tax=Nocardia vinacea TaxID=96468 RepID=UPI0003074AB9|nr:hypothetical protein [Nocardia vinacea]